MDEYHLQAQAIMDLRNGTPTDPLQLTLLASTLNASTREWMLLAFVRFGFTYLYKIEYMNTI